VDEIREAEAGGANGADLNHDNVMAQLGLEEEMGLALVALSRKAGWYTYLRQSNGREALSIRIGLLQSQLVSECSCYSVMIFSGRIHPAS
jgi:hypothetical protein